MPDENILANIEPETREETFLQDIADGTQTLIPAVRKEEFLRRIAEAMGEGGLPDITEWDEWKMLIVDHGKAAWSRPTNVVQLTSEFTEFLQDEILTLITAIITNNTPGASSEYTGMDYNGDIKELSGWHELMLNSGIQYQIDIDGDGHLISPVYSASGSVIFSYPDLQEISGHTYLFTYFIKIVDLNSDLDTTPVTYKIAVIKNL